MEFDMGNLIFIVYSEKNYTHYNLTICRWFSSFYSGWILSGWYKGEDGHCTWPTSNICNRQTTCVAKNSKKMVHWRYMTVGKLYSKQRKVKTILKLRWTSMDQTFHLAPC
jgi:hypothetical protein